MSEVYSLEFHPEGQKKEQYLMTTTGHLEWMEPDLMVIDDLDFILTKYAKSSLAKYLSFSNKLMKLLSNNGEEHNKFKSIFASIASAQNLEIVAKIDEDETGQGIIEGFLSPSAFRILNDFLKIEIIPKLLQHPNIIVKYSYSSASDITYVFQVTEMEPISFAGKVWHPGFVLNNSSLGLYSVSVTPALIPDKAMSFYSLPFTIDGAIYYPENIEELNSPNIAGECIKLAAWCSKGVKSWENRLNNTLSVNEYQNLMSGMLPCQDLIPEKKIIGRLAMIYDAHDLNVDEGKPSHQWAKTADSGTLVGEFLEILFEIDLDSDWENCPVYTLGGLLDNHMDLKNMADNARASKNLDGLEWPA